MKSQLIGKDSDAGKDCGKDKKGMTEDEIVDGTTDSMNLSLSKLWKIVKNSAAWHVEIHGVTKSQTWLIHCTTTAGVEQQWS